MLVITRRPGEEIVIDEKIIIKIVRVQGNQVRIGVTAPRDVKIKRRETCDLPENIGNK